MYVGTYAYSVVILYGYSCICLDTLASTWIFLDIPLQESWDYIGSSRMVLDIERGAFKHFTLDDISHYLELSHVGLQNPNTSQPTFYAHMNPPNVCGREGGHF